MPATTVEQAEGPFSEYLTQAKRPDPPQPNGWGGKPALVMTIADQFLRGVQQGRMASFERRENEKLKGIQEFDQTVQHLYANPDLTPEGRDMIQQEWMKAKGHHLQEAADEQGGGGKGSGGKSGKHGNPLVQIFKQIGEGMAGGPLPKGAKDLESPETALGRITKIYADPKFRVSKGIEGVQGEMQQAVQGANPEFFEDAAKVAEPFRQRLNALKEGAGDREVGSLSLRYQQRPKVGSAEDLLYRATAPQPPGPTTQQPQQPQQPQPPGSPARYDEMGRRVTQAGVASEQKTTPAEFRGAPPRQDQYGRPVIPAASVLPDRIPGGPPDAGQGSAGGQEPQQGPHITPAVLSALIAGKKYAKESPIRYPDQNGEMQTQTAYEVTIGGGVQWYGIGSGGNLIPLDPSKVSKTRLGEPVYQAHERLAFDAFRQAHPDTAGRPLEPKERIQAIADYEKATKPGGSVATANEQIAFDAYRERNHIAPDVELKGAQKIEALKQMKEKLEPGDAAAMKAINLLLAEERVTALREGRADVKMIAESIMDGTSPPDLSRLYGKSSQVRAELARHPEFNLKDAQLDWQGSQAWVRTVNSTAQVRLRQATNFAYESLDLVEDLSKKVSKAVPRSQFPVFNKAALAAARGGAFGKDAQEAANNLQIQIRDIQSELATVYKGGGSPTDKGIKSAMDMLEGDWSESTLRSALDLTRKNLRIRLNSIKNSPALFPESAGASMQTPPPPGAAPPNPFATPAASSAAAPVSSGIKILKVE